MFKVSIRHFLFCFTCIVGLMMGAQYLAPGAHAAQGTITLTLPNGGTLLGHPGTPVVIIGAGLVPSTAYNLFTTPNPAPTACSAQNPAQLAQFTNTNTDPTGAFQLTAGWPANAAMATTNYFVCAIPAGGGQNGAGTLSGQSFTVAQQVTLTLSSQTVQPGGSITVTGASWVPPQTINVSIIGNAGTVASQQTQSDTMGNFTVTLNIPTNATSGTYTVKAFAPNEPTAAMSATTTFTVGQQTTATATTTPTSQPTSTPVPTHTPGNGGGGGGGMDVLIFGLGGLGAVLVIIGITVYVVYSNKRQPGY